MPKKSVIIKRIKRKYTYWELKRNTPVTLFIFFLFLFFVLWFFKNVDDDKRNHAVAMDEEINKFVCLLLSSFFSHSLITRFFSIPSLFLLERNFFKRQTPSPLILFRISFFIYFATTHAAGLLLLLLFRCHYAWWRRK